MTSAAMSTSAVGADRQDPWEKSLIQVREMTAVLRGPMLASERHPSLRLLSHLGTLHPQPHLAAIRSLAAAGVPAASYALIEVLGDPDFPYRVEAAEALRRNPQRPAVEPLIEALDDPDHNLRRVACARSIGPTSSTSACRWLAPQPTASPSDSE